MTIFFSVSHKRFSVGMEPHAAECEASCPKGIDISNIARMNREYLAASVKAY